MFKKLAFLGVMISLMLNFNDTQSLGMRELPATWHSAHSWQHHPLEIHKFSKHYLELDRETSAKYYLIKSELMGLKAVSSVPSTQCNTSNTGCAAALGYVNITDFPGHTGGGVTGGGSGDDEPPMLAAANAACTSGQKLVRFPPGVYNMQTQFNSPCDGLVMFAASENLSYDPESHPNASTRVNINSGFFMTANHIWYNANGRTDNVWWAINISGDGGQNGISDFGTSFNYVGVGQIPRMYLFDFGAGGAGTVVGCGINTSGSGSTFATPYTGTGTTCANYMGWRLFNVNASENALAANGNITDMFWKGGVISGNACGGIVGANNGTEGMVLDIDTIEENGINGFAGVCATGGPGLEINGPLWDVHSRFQANGGTAIYFDGNCAADTITGTYSGDGIYGTQGKESEFAFNASCASTISLNGMAGGSGYNGLAAPKYLFENISGTSTIGLFGGNYDSTQYSIGLKNTVAGTLTLSPMLVLGQPETVPNLTVSNISGSTQCVRANSSGVLSGTGSDCSTATPVSVTAGTPNIVITPTPGTGTFTVGGADVINAQTTTTPYTIVAGDMGKTVTHNKTTAVPVTLPQAGGAGFLAGSAYTECNYGAGIVTITPTTSTINGAASVPLNQNECIYPVSDGANWFGLLAKIPTAFISYQPGLLTALNATKAVVHKFPQAATVVNIEGSANTFSCVSNPTITVFECGTSTTCASSPVTIGTVTVTAAGTVVDGTINSAAITAGDYVAFAETAGTCASSDIAVTVGYHEN